MWIASRTPEGEPAACEICGVEIWIEPSLTTRDGVCPNCGSLVWFAPEATPQPIEGPWRVRNWVFGKALHKFGWPITAGDYFISQYPSGDGAAWIEAVEKAGDWSEFVVLIAGQHLED
jgi:hypothetical protein